MFAPAFAVGGPVLITPRSATLPIADEAELLLLPAFGSAADDVAAVMTTVPGEDCAVTTRVSAAVPFTAIDEAVHDCAVVEPEQVKPPPVALTMVPLVTVT